MFAFIFFVAMISIGITMFLYDNLPDERRDWAFIPMTLTICCFVVGFVLGAAYEAWLWGVICGYNGNVIIAVEIAFFAFVGIRWYNDFKPGTKSEPTKQTKQTTKPRQSSKPKKKSAESKTVKPDNDMPTIAAAQIKPTVSTTLPQRVVSTPPPIQANPTPPPVQTGPTPPPVQR